MRRLVSEVTIEHEAKRRRLRKCRKKLSDCFTYLGSAEALRFFMLNLKNIVFIVDILLVLEGDASCRVAEDLNECTIELVEEPFDGVIATVHLPCHDISPALADR
jgi:hypothetical protein